MLVKAFPFIFIYFLWPRHAACGILVPQPGIEPGPLAVKAQSPNHWTSKEFPGPTPLSLPLQATHHMATAMGMTFPKIPALNAFLYLGIKCVASWDLITYASPCCPFSTSHLVLSGHMLQVPPSSGPLLKLSSTPFICWVSASQKPRGSLVSPALATSRHLVCWMNNFCQHYSLLILRTLRSTWRSLLYTKEKTENKAICPRSPGNK